MIDRLQLREIDWTLISLLVLNSLIGLVLIYSATRLGPGNFFLRQAAWLGISLLALFLVLSIDYKLWMGISPYLMGLAVAALAALLAFGRGVSGARSWLRLAFVGGQPSEPAKIAALLLVALIFSDFRRSRVAADVAALGGGVVLVPMLLVAAQPDMGTAMSFLPILIGAFILAGMSRRTVAIVLIAGLVLGLVGWNLVLKDYQKKRIQTLLNPNEDPRGSGYHVRQSRIAIGSGGLTGKGFLKGTQSQLRFLPEHQTDFIFSVYAEEWGFIGGLLLLILFVSVIFWGLRIARQSRDLLGTLIAFGITMLLFWEMLINIGMVLGILPVVGIPLPFFSYGGSALVVLMMATGLLMNISMRRFMLQP